MRRGRPSPFRACFVDTSAYFALADRRDTNHEVAQRVFRALAAQRTTHVTTNYVIAETHALLVNRLHPVDALTFIQRLQAGNTTILRVPPPDEERAWQIIRSYTDKGFSSTDATSFVTMERLGMTHAFHYDRDFGQYGFIQLTPDLF